MVIIELEKVNFFQYNTERYENLRTLSELERGWVAALIDGEGYFTLKIQRVITKRGSGVSFRIGPRLGISNTCFELLYRMNALCPSWLGNLRTRKGCKPCLNYEMSADGLRWLLPQIIDLLIAKKRQANVVLEVLSLLKDHHSYHQPHIERLLQLRLEMLSLNSVGVTRHFSKKGLF